MCVPRNIYCFGGSEGFGFLFGLKEFVVGLRDSYMVHRRFCKMGKKICYKN